MISYNELLQELWERPERYTKLQCSLDLIVDLTHTKEKYTRARSYRETLALASNEKLEDLLQRHRRKRLIVAPVESLEDVEDWHELADDIPNLIPYYQYRFDLCVPTQPYTTWYFIMRYLHIVCGFAVEEVKNLVTDVYRVTCQLRRKGVHTIDRIMMQLETNIKYAEQHLQRTAFTAYQLKRYKQAQEMYTNLLSSKERDDCSICYNSMVDFTVTACNHVFCTHCLLTWLSESDMATCPMCRSSLEGRDYYISSGNPVCEEHGHGKCNAVYHIHCHLKDLVRKISLYYRRDR